MTIQHRSRLCVGLVCAGLALRPVRTLAAQQDPRTHAGKIIPGSVDNAHLPAAADAAARAVAARLDSVLRRVPEIAAPRGYDVELRRIVSGGKALLRRAEPVIAGVDAYFYRYAFDPSTGSWQAPQEGLSVSLMANDLSCVFAREGGSTIRHGDAAGGFFARPDSVERLGERIRFGPGCIVVTHIDRPLWLPVSQERYLTELVHEADSVAAGATRHQSHVGDNLRMLLSLDSTHRAMAPRIAAEVTELRKTDPAAAERERQQFAAEGKELDSSIAAERGSSTDHLELNDVAGGVARALKAELASLDAAKRAAPAYWLGSSPRPSHLVDGPERGTEAIVTVNPAFFDHTLPATVAQTITIRSFLPATSQFYDPWEAGVFDRIREGLLRANLGAMVRP